MPIFSSTMAIPIIERRRESHVLIINNSNSNVPETITGGFQYNLIMKLIQMILSLLALVLFLCGINSTKIQFEDLIMCTLFGALLIYPLLFIMFSVKTRRQSLYMIVQNFCASFISLIISVMIISSWWRNKMDLDRRENQEMDVKLRYALILKLISSCISIINGILYFTETLIMHLEIKGYI